MSDAALASGFTDYRAAMRAVDQGNVQAAMKLFDQALQEGLRPALREEAYYNRGVLYHRQGRYELAIADYSNAIKLKPDDARAYNNRGVAYKNERRYDLALADYDAAIRLQPDDASAHYNRGNAYVQQGQAERAIADFNDAIRLRAGAAPDASNYFDESKFKASAAGVATAHRSAGSGEAEQYMLIWRYLAERRNGEDGRQELALGAGKLRSRNWPYPVISFFLGKLGRGEVLAAAQESGAADGRHGCEAAAYLGEDDLLRGNTDSALHLFSQALDLCPADSAERSLVVAERQRKSAQH